MHAALLTVGWGILIPTGILLARSFKRHDPLWFYGHIAVQTLGLALGIAGVGIGFHLVGGWTAPNDTVQTHRDLGVTILVLGVVQVCWGAEGGMVIFGVCVCGGGEWG